ncbi:MAG: hypothetical protein V2A54_03035 [Bacteroidota bacterium]
MKHILILFLLLISVQIHAQSDVEQKIKDREEKYSDFQVMQNSAQSDSSYVKSATALQKLREVVELDNDIIDVLSSRSGSAKEDSIRIKTLTDESNVMTQEFENQSQMRIYLFSAIGLFFILFGIFLILYLGVKGKVSDYRHESEIEKQKSHKLDAEVSKLKEEAKKEYGNLKEATDDELTKRSRRETELMDEIEKLKMNPQLTASDQDVLAEVEKARIELTKTTEILEKEMRQKHELEQKVKYLQDALDKKAVSPEVEQRLTSLELSVTRMEKLTRLREINAITQEEFDLKKKDILNEL